MTAKAYMWYSGATDVTGTKLAEALKIDHGREKPTGKEVIIGWGAKTSEPVQLPKTSQVLNHPDAIRINRNKLGSLDKMLKAGVSVAPFIPAEDIADIGKKKAGVALPVIGRTKYHQGGKGFWNCPTMTQVKLAVKEGAQYFQNLIEVVDEFRYHVFGDEVIYAVKKTKRTTAEMEEAYIRHEMDRQLALAEKNGDTLDKATMEVFLRRQAKKFAQDGANALIRSNRLGWKFVKVKSVDKKLKEESIKALKALGLEFGAVDGCIDADGKPWIFEVNTGPGLEQSPFDAYVEAFRKRLTKIASGGTSSPKKATTQKVGGTIPTTTDKKSDLQRQLDMAKNMVANAEDDTEVETLKKVFSKMFG